MIYMNILAGLGVLILVAMGLALIFDKMDNVANYLKNHPKVFPTCIGIMMLLIAIGVILGLIKHN